MPHPCPKFNRLPTESCSHAAPPNLQNLSGRIYQFPSYPRSNPSLPLPSSSNDVPLNPLALSFELIGLISSLVGIAFAAYEVWKCRKSAVTEKKMKTISLKKKSGRLDSSPPPKTVDWSASANEQPKLASKSQDNPEVFFCTPSPPSFLTYNLSVHAVVLLIMLALSLGFSAQELSVVCPSPNFRFPEGADFPTFYTLVYNGPPSFGQLVGILNGTLLTTRVDPLGWNGNPFSWLDDEERFIQCDGNVNNFNSDLCAGLKAKILMRTSLQGTVLEPSLASLFPFTAISVASLTLALLFTAVQLVLVLKFKVQRLSDSSITTCIPSALVSFAFSCMLASLIPSSSFLSQRLSPSVDPLLLRNMSDNFVSSAGLWFGGGQTIFGSQFVSQILPLPTITQVCELSSSSVNFRAVALAMSFLAGLCGVSFRGSYLLLLKNANLQTQHTLPDESIEMQATVPPAVNNPLNGDKV